MFCLMAALYPKQIRAEHTAPRPVSIGSSYHFQYCYPELVMFSFVYCSDADLSHDYRKYDHERWCKALHERTQDATELTVKNASFRV